MSILRWTISQNSEYILPLYHILILLIQQEFIVLKKRTRGRGGEGVWKSEIWRTYFMATLYHKKTNINNGNIVELPYNGHLWEKSRWPL